MADSRRLNSNIASLQIKHFFVPWIMSLKSIINKISCVQNGIWSSCMSRRVGAEPSKEFCPIIFSHSNTGVFIEKHNTYIFTCIYVDAQSILLQVVDTPMALIKARQKA